MKISGYIIRKLQNILKLKKKRIYINITHTYIHIHICWNP